MNLINPYVRFFLLAAIVLLTPQPSFASGYWTSFKKYWSDYVGQQNGIVMTVLVVGVISVFIVTRGRWRK